MILISRSIRYLAVDVPFMKKLLGLLLSKETKKKLYFVPQSLGPYIKLTIRHNSDYTARNTAW